MRMLERIRSEFKSEDRETILVLGLSMTVVGVLTASGASDIGISVLLGTVVTICGLLMLVGTVIWGDDEQAQNDS